MASFQTLRRKLTKHLCWTFSFALKPILPLQQVLENTMSAFLLISVMFPNHLYCSLVLYIWQFLTVICPFFSLFLVFAVCVSTYVWHQNQLFSSWGFWTDVHLFFFFPWKLRFHHFLFWRKLVAYFTPSWCLGYEQFSLLIPLSNRNLSRHVSVLS